MLKYLRRIIAVLSIITLTLLFVDFTGTVAVHWAWLAKIQLVPALLSVNALAVVFLVVLTLIFGRLYCSVICPMGIFQDVVERFRHWFAPKKKKKLGLYRFEPERRVWRYTLLGLFVVLLIVGHLGLIATSLAGILDPYSAYGRIAGQFFVPLWRIGALAVAETAASKGTYILAGYPPQWYFSLGVTIVAAITALIVMVMAWRTGRGYCNTICPVGTLLGLLSRYSLLKPVIDTDKCNRCGSCGRKCKAKCIDTKNHVIDYSRCVVCFDCINNCSQGAISYKIRRSEKHADAPATDPTGRRNFIIGTAVVAGTLAAKAGGKTGDGGFAPLKSKKTVPGTVHPVPAGAISIKHLRSHCTACQLCISECPNQVLRPSASFEAFMQPEMVFNSGYCHTDCNRCAEICPAGAIKPIDLTVKAVTKIGTAVVDPDICLSASQGVSCGSCSRYCPAEAIQMVETAEGTLRPVVDEVACIGCGSCEFHCPVGTVESTASNYPAIHVNAVGNHRQI
ncbi:MAG: 4Fe-4S dicluster domain-containing protein [Bacteroidales bacterium]|nr:4Fe-4S dicluster domain-containing protein [Bacteroidales bacterium]